MVWTPQPSPSEDWTELPKGITLVTDLVSHWRLGEAAGVRVDAYGLHDLTETGSVTQMNGKLGAAAQFVTDGVNHLITPNTPALFTADGSFTVAAWNYLVDKPAVAVVLSKGSDADGWDWDIEYFGAPDDRYFFVLYAPGGSSVGFVSADSFGSPPVGSWHLFVGWYDAADGSIHIQVDNGPVDSVSVSRTQITAAGPVVVGDWLGYPQPWNGGVDSASIWKRLLTSAERTSLYNNGDGLDFLWAPTDIPADAWMAALTHPAGAFGAGFFGEGLFGGKWVGEANPSGDWTEESAGTP